jgi:hypothetical protein
MPKLWFNEISDAVVMASQQERHGELLAMVSDIAAKETCHLDVIRHPQTGETLLMRFAKSIALNNVTKALLYEYSCDLLACDHRERIALHCALAHNNDAMAVAMLDSTPAYALMLDVVTKDRTYALSLAVRNKNVSMVRSLLGRGARLLTPSDTCENVLLLSVAGAQSFAICRELVRDLNIESKYSSDDLHALMYAPAEWDETRAKYGNFWDFVWWWDGPKEPDNWRYSSLGNPLLELAWKTACVRQLELPFMLTHQNAPFQVAYRQFLKSWR